MTTRSERFRERVELEYADLSAADREVIEEVAATLDLIDRLRAEIADGPLVEVRQGGPRVRPEVVEARLQTVSLQRLLARFPALSEED